MLSPQAAMFLQQPQWVYPYVQPPVPPRAITHQPATPEIIEEPQLETPFWDDSLDAEHWFDPITSEFNLFPL
jgi:hypothetical protein